MSEKEFKEFQDKLDKGLLLAEKQMLEEKALHGQSVVVMNDDGKIIHIPASQVLADNEIFHEIEISKNGDPFAMKASGNNSASYRIDF
ncbi:MAG: hypothetical protein IKN98_04310 [Bacteroidales bacterium]|nr:hypothetical protein [Bacteroidales bacterium]